MKSIEESGFATEVFTPKEVEHTCASGRTFKLRELSAFQQMSADSISDKYQSSLYCRMAMSLAGINGGPLPPAHSELMIKARLERLSGAEADELFLAYMKAFIPRGEDLKNESTPAA